MLFVVCLPALSTKSPLFRKTHCPKRRRGCPENGTNFPIYMGGVGAVGALAKVAGVRLALDVREPFRLM
jgi:hypothetical protein